MGTVKIKVVTTLLSVLLTISCNSESAENKKNMAMISKIQYDEKVAELKKTNGLQSIVINENIQKGELINNIVNELRIITESSTRLRFNVETGRAETSHADEIKDRLSELKRKLNAIPKSNNNDRVLVATIKNLNGIIAQKDIEINELSKNIERQDKVIASQVTKINNQEVAIQEKERQLLIQQQNYWYQMAEELYQISKELPITRGKKDKRNIKDTKSYILIKSKTCYEMAQKLGHRSAHSQIIKIEQELNEL